MVGCQELYRLEGEESATYAKEVAYWIRRRDSASQSFKGMRTGCI
jgi:hypothetical protein